MQSILSSISKVSSGKADGCVPIRLITTEGIAFFIRTPVSTSSYIDAVDVSSITKSGENSITILIVVSRSN